MIGYKLYVNQNIDHWMRLCNEDYNNITECRCQSIDNGYILPLKEENDGLAADISYRGGVCDEQGNFVAGLVRKYYNLKMNYSCYDKYEIQEDDLFWQDDEIIYGGVLFSYFGHCMTESFSRLWYLLEDTSDRKIVFTNVGNVPEYFWTFMELLEIEKERIIFLDKPTRYRRVIVPDQVFVMFGGYHPKFSQLYDIMAYNATKEECGVGKKVYLSRTLFEKRDYINEEYFENFYRNRGYVVVHTERETLQKQIAIIREAKEIVSTAGTLAHLVLFAKENTKLTMLLRENEPGAVKPQIIFNQLKNISCTIVDVSYNFLPANHSWGIHLLGPTNSFFKYIQGEEIACLSEDEKKMDWETTLYSYIMSWIRFHSSNNYAYKRMHSLDIFDVINRMSTILNDTPLDRKMMPTVSKDNSIYIPRDIRLIDIEIRQQDNWNFAKVCLDKKNNNPVYNSIMVQELRRILDTLDIFDLVQFDDSIHSFGFDDDVLKKIYYATVEVVFYECSRKPGSIKQRYIATHGRKSWDIMESVLKEKYPDYYQESRWIFENNVLYPYNAFIMKKGAFLDLASWLLPLLEEIGNQIETEEQYLLDYLSEQLITVYFEARIKTYIYAFKEK